MEDTNFETKSEEKEERGIMRSRSLEQIGGLSLESLELFEPLEQEYNPPRSDNYELSTAREARNKQRLQFDTSKTEMSLHELAFGRVTPVNNSRERFSTGLTRSASQILPAVSSSLFNWKNPSKADYKRLLATLKRQLDRDLVIFEQICEQTKSSLKEDAETEKHVYSVLIQIASSIRNFRVVSVDLVTLTRFFKERIFCLERLRRETSKLQWSRNQFNISPVIKLLFILSKISRVTEEVEFELSEVEDYMTELAQDSFTTSDPPVFTNLWQPRNTATNISRRNILEDVAILEDVLEEKLCTSVESTVREGRSSSTEKTTPEELELCRICERYFSLDVFEQHTTSCAKEARYWMKYEEINKKLRLLLGTLDEKVDNLISSLIDSERKLLFKFLAYVSSVCILLTGLESSYANLERTVTMSEKSTESYGNEMLEEYKDMYQVFFSCHENIVLDRDKCIIERGLSLNVSLKVSLESSTSSMKSLLLEILDGIKEILELRLIARETRNEQDVSLAQDNLSIDGSECGASSVGNVTETSSEDSREEIFPKKMQKDEEDMCKTVLKKRSMTSSKNVEKGSLETSENIHSEGSNRCHLCDNFIGGCCSHGIVPSIDDFYILKAISRGAFGRVYLVRKKKTGDIYALKAINKSEMIRKNLVNQVLAERDILAGVHTSFVVKFFWSFETTDKFFIVMEYVPGGDLYSLLRNVGFLEEPIVKQYLAETVLALEELHSVGVIHRDLKPDNMLITKEGHLKLTDFGLSRLGLLEGSSNMGVQNSFSNVSIPSEESKTEYSNDKDVRNISHAIGTPDYLAPEILLGSGHSFTVDWWCLGVVGYELLVGYPPFHDDTPSKIFANILNHRLTWPELPISNAMKDFIERLLESDPLRRLGAKGSQQVKEHPVFSDVDWESILQKESCFKPQCDAEDDTSYFISPKPLSSLHSICQTGVVLESSQLPIFRNSATLQSIISKERSAYMNTFTSQIQMDFAFRDLDNLEAMNMQVLRERFAKLHVIPG